MHPWIEYIRERFPQVVYASLAGGIAFSGAYLNKSAVHFAYPILVFAAVWAFLFVLRLIHDLQNINKDRLAFPDRLLPSGRIAEEEADRVIFLFQILLCAYSELLWIILQGTAALACLCLAGFSWLAHKNFYLKNLMERFPLLKIVVRPMYGFLLAFFTVSANEPDRIFGVKAWAYGFVLYGAFLTYDICRKLNPQAHPILATFVHFYGFRKAFFLAVIALLLSAGGALALDNMLLLWPMECLVLISLSILFFQPQSYRLPEMAAAVSLLLHAWVGIF
jgi:hypothetical protein